MITHKIEKEWPTLTASVVSNAFLDRVNRNHPRIPYHMDKSHWDKVTYAQWIEKVKSKFAVDDYVCMAQIVENSYICPWWYRIEYINELHYNCDWDSYDKEPKALLCVDRQGNKVNRTPKSLRLLTELEKHRAGLSDL